MYAGTFVTVTAVLPLPILLVTGFSVNFSPDGRPATFTFVSESALAATGHSMYTPAQILVRWGEPSPASRIFSPFTASLMLSLFSSSVTNLANTYRISGTVTLIDAASDRQGCSDETHSPFSILHFTFLSYHPANT